MGATYLTAMADWFRAAGLTVVEQDGWQSRSRSSGGYESGRPWCVMWHHTASSTSPANDASYCSYGSPDRPICNLLMARDGTVWVLAAGATNTNGKGGPQTFSKGTVPTDRMNEYAVGIEIATGRTGEAYPQAQLDATFTVSNVLAERLALAATDVCTHYVWAPTRKVDPAKATSVQGPWQPRSCTSSGTWDLTDLRNECARRYSSGGAEGDDDMPLTQGDIDKIADAVWSKMIDTTGPGSPDPQPARYFLQRSFLIARQYLGGFSGKPATDPTMLKQILDQTKK